MDTRSGQIRSNTYQKVTQFKDSTSDFTKIDVDSLNIIFKNYEDIIPEIKNENIDVPILATLNNVNQNDILSLNENDEDKAFSLGICNENMNLFMSLISIIKNEELIRGTDESKTDTFVNYLFRIIEYDKYPLMFELKTTCKFEVGNKFITSEFDFGVKRKKTVLLLDEDKHFKNTGRSKAWGEYQIAGEILAAAVNNYNNSIDNPTIFAVRVIGTRFTFYRSCVPNDYLFSLSEGFPDKCFEIARYPSQLNDKELSGFLDFKKCEERKIILNILAKIRKYILINLN